MRWWPPSWGKTEARADFTTTRTDAAYARATGSAVDAGALAIVEACYSFWERAFSTLAIRPSSMALAGVTPGFLALVGRTLAARGELVAAIQIGVNGSILLPTTSHDVTGGANPATWFYRADFTGPSTAYTRGLRAGEVLHFRLGADVKAPWRGRSPLSRAIETGALSVAIEEAIKIESQLPIGRVAPYSGTPEEATAFGESLVDGGITSIGASTPGGAMAGQEPSARHKPQAYGPEPSQTMTELRSKAGVDLCAAFGLPPSLFDPGAAGPGQLASVRRFWATTIEPMALCIEAELREKLSPDARVRVPQLRMADEDALSRSAERRARAFKVYIEAGLKRDEALRLAGAENAE